MKTKPVNTTENVGLPKTDWPENLASIVPSGEMVQWTFEAVQTYFWSGRTGTAVLGGPFNPRVLLTLLTFSYATGVFGSAAIAERCGRDDLFRYLSVGIHFAPDRIRLFRGQNSELLRRCLAHVIRRVLDREDMADLDNLFRAADESGSPTRGTAGTRMLLSQREARRRFEAAVSADSNLGFPAATSAPEFRGRRTGYIPAEN